MVSAAGCNARARLTVQLALFWAIALLAALVMGPARDLLKALAPATRQHGTVSEHGTASEDTPGSSVGGLWIQELQPQIQSGTSADRQSVLAKSLASLPEEPRPRSQSGAGPDGQSDDMSRYTASFRKGRCCWDPPADGGVHDDTIVVRATAMRGRRNIHVLSIGKTGTKSLGSVMSVINHESGQTEYFGKVYNHQDSFRPFENCRRTTRPYIFGVRAPIERFVSAWYENKYGQGGAHFIRHDAEFPTPDALACALSSSNKTRQRMANKSMRSIFHVRLTPITYLHNLEQVKLCADKIFGVYRTEHFNIDFADIIAKMFPPGDPSTAPMYREIVNRTNLVFSHPSERPKVERVLGECAVGNLQRWLEQDYLLIDFLAERGCVPSDYPTEVRDLDVAYR